MLCYVFYGSVVLFVCLLVILMVCLEKLHPAVVAQSSMLVFTLRSEGKESLFRGGQIDVERKNKKTLKLIYKNKNMLKLSMLEYLHRKRTF